jgi:hypothetical protein
MKAVGRFGIGFFSVFMLGDDVRVMTRRYDRGMADTLALEFKEGLRLRPILAPAERSEAPLDGGTRVEVRLTDDPRSEAGMRLALKSGDAHREDSVPSSLPDLVAWLAPALDVDVMVEDFGRRSIALRANDWLTIAPEALAARIGAYNRLIPDAAPFMRQIASSQGTIYGRAAIIPSHTGGAGIFAIGGLRADTEDWFMGILAGGPMRAARDRAGLTVPRELLGQWATDQGRLVATSKIPPEDKVMIANRILSCGGEVGALPIIQWHGLWMDTRMLAEHCREATEIRILWGPPIFEDDEGYETMEDDEFEPCDEFAIIPIYETVSDTLKLPVVKLVTAIAQAAWGGIEDTMASLPIGTSGGLPLIYHVHRLRKP